MIHSDARQLAVRARGVGHEEAPLGSKYAPGQAGPTHSLDLHCHYDINEMPLKRCVCSPVTRGRRGEERREIDVEPT